MSSYVQAGAETEQEAHTEPADTIMLEATPPMKVPTGAPAGRCLYSAMDQVAGPSNCCGDVRRGIFWHIPGVAFPVNMTCIKQHSQLMSPVLFTPTKCFSFHKQRRI